MRAGSPGWDGRCPNCDAVPAGAWCQACGQKAGPAHRSLLHLGHEFAELLTHADSRIWRTLRLLALRPGALTRDYLLGRRMRQVPPLRLFFVVLLLVFGVGSLDGGRPARHAIPAAELAKIEPGIDAIRTGSPTLDRWLVPHLHHAARDPDAVLAVMRDWLERFALLLPPIAALILWPLFAFARPRPTLFDHLVFALHSLSFAGLVQVAVFTLRWVVPDNGLLILLLLLPAHLFRHLRGTYGGGVAATLSRMAVLGAASSVAVALLALGLGWLGLQLGAAG